MIGRKIHSKKSHEMGRGRSERLPFSPRGRAVYVLLVGAWPSSAIIEESTIRSNDIVWECTRPQSCSPLSILHSEGSGYYGYVLDAIQVCEG